MVVCGQIAFAEAADVRPSIGRVHFLHGVANGWIKAQISVSSEICCPLKCESMD